jgi:hypothetical protein
MAARGVDARLPAARVHERGVDVHAADAAVMRNLELLQNLKLLRNLELFRSAEARPSDGIALALGNALPVFVARKVLDRAGMSPDALENPESAPMSSISRAFGYGTVLPLSPRPRRS